MLFHSQVQLNCPFVQPEFRMALKLAHNINQPSTCATLQNLGSTVPLKGNCHETFPEIRTQEQGAKTAFGLRGEL